MATRDHGIMTIVISKRYGMKTIAAGSFKLKCLSIVNEVHAKCEAVIITKHGKPVAKLVPVNAEKDEIYDFLAGKGAIVGDIIAPALFPEEPGALRQFFGCHASLTKEQ
jgi:prevent-host-death family protein